MSTTYPFLLLLLLLLLLPLPFTTATTITLHPYPHSHKPSAAALELPYNQPTSLTLSLSPIHPSESLKSLTHTLPRPSTISLTRTPTRHILKAELTLRQIGVTNLSITAATTNPVHLYTRVLTLTVPGATIAYPRPSLPAPLPRVNLGTFLPWAAVSQLAFPLLVQRPRAPHPRLRVSVSSAGAVPPGVCVLRLREAAPGGHNTRVYRGSEVATAAVHFPPRCGIALSPDRAWIVIRLNPYRVGRYGFRVVFRFVRAGGLAASGSAMALRFMYEHVVPPVVITHCRVRLDPSGGELLQIPVENVLSPPRKTPLKKHHFVLKLFSGADLVALLKPVDMVRIGRTPRHILRFRTNPIRGKYGRLRIVLETPGSNAVIDPRHNVTIAVMSRRTAVLDQCTPDVADKRFVKISMRVPYNRATFTEWKNVLMKRALTHFFSARGDDRIRLVGVGRDIVTYAVLVSGVDRKHALDARILEMNRAVRNGSFADAVHAWQHHLSAREVVYMNTSMCAAFPHLVAGVSLHEIRGLQISLLPLCTSFPIALGFIITILLAQNSPAKSRETVSSYRSKVSTEEGSTNCEFGKAYNSKADSEETCYAPVCSYPSEAREKFARRYGLRDKITSDNLRDSDLESTVDGEQKEGVGKLVDVFRKFGQSFGGLGHIWRKLRGYEAQEVQISARTASTNRSPTIYIERVSYDCDSHSVGYG